MVTYQFSIRQPLLNCLWSLLLSILLIFHLTSATARTGASHPPPIKQKTAVSAKKGPPQAKKPQNTAEDAIEDLKKKLYVKDSAIEEQIKEQKKATSSHYGIAFDEPTYVLPFYYTGSPDTEIYPPYQNPANQPVKPEEFKAQLSLLFPVLPSLFKGTGLYVSYTQLSYWQFYSKSQYFRETNYEPAIFLRRHVLANAEWRLGLVHQSNGRGLPYERSWNRAYLDFRISGEKWFISLKPWFLIFKNDSSNIHNPDIADYLGYGRIILAYKLYNQTFSLMLRNIVASGFKRGAVELTWSFPLFSTKLKGMVQFFSGYGQSLIEYDHYTNSAGIGIALSDWI